MAPAAVNHTWALQAAPAMRVTLAMAPTFQVDQAAVAAAEALAKVAALISTAAGAKSFVYPLILCGSVRRALHISMLEYPQPLCPALQ